MANNIGGIGGYGYNIGNFYTNNQNKNLQGTNEQNVQQENTQPTTINVDQNEVLNFLAASSIQITAPTIANDNDAALNNRVEGFVQTFDMFYSVIAQEFGDNAANTLMNDDAFLDTLMNLQ